MENQLKLGRICEIRKNRFIISFEEREIFAVLKGSFYDAPPAERHEEWKRLLGIYQPWLRLDGEIPFFSEGMGWQKQSHIYEAPFYYIDYCLAQTVSLEFWAMLQKDEKAAWERYMAYTEQGGSCTFTELLAHANLSSPFDEACLKTVCEAAKKWLDEFDMTGME